MLTPFRAVLLLTILVSLPIALFAAGPITPVTPVGSPAPGAASPDLASGESTAAAPRPADAAAENFWQALKLLRSAKPADHTAGRVALQSASDLEYTHAQVLLANCLVAGSHGIKKDAPRGASLFRLAAERGNAFAKISLGQCYFTGTGVRMDKAKAAEWLTAALSPDADFSRPVPPPDFAATDSGPSSSAENSGVAGELVGDPVSESQATAHYLLGQIAGEQKKLEEAQAHYVAAALAGPDGRNGVYPAALQAALNFAFGNGTPRDLAKANEMLDQSRKLAGRMGVSLIHNYVSLKIVDEFATADLEEAMTKASEAYETELQFKIASTFADKKSKDYNIAEAVKWYELAAESGQVWAMLSLAFIYIDGELGQPDLGKAYHWFEKVGGGDKPKHMLGLANLAICYENGLGTEKNQGKASALFQKHRDTNIVCYLGTIGQCPSQFLNGEQELALLQTWAKEKNDAHSQYLLGHRFLSGYGVKEDLKEAAKWYKKSAKGGDASGLNQLGYLYSQRGLDLGCKTWAEALKAAADYYTKAVEAGSVIGLCNLGYLAETGKGMRLDNQKAKSFYERCIQLDPTYSDAHNNLANILQAELQPTSSGLRNEFVRNGQDGSVDNNPAHTTVAKTINAKAIEIILGHYNAANNEGNAFAAYNLGCLYRDGKFCRKDAKKAYGFFETAAERGLIASRLALGEMLEHGEGVAVSYSEAAYQYRLAAVEGDPEALRRLVDFYVAGKGVSRDLDRAIYWISILAEKGDLRIEPRLGDLYIQNQNYEEALALFTQLTESPLSEIRGTANQRLSVLYARGWGVAADPKKARKYREKALTYDNLPALHDTAMTLISDGRRAAGIKLLERAVDRGLPSAKFELGRLCMSGDGVTKNLARGLKLFTEAAERGYEDAQVALAELTLENFPGAPDLETAIKFADSAAASNHTKAAELREKLEERRQKSLVAPEDTAKARAS